MVVEELHNVLCKENIEKMIMIILLLAILAIGSANGQAVIPTIQPPVNPCDTFQCASGTKCKLQDSLCRTGPCYVPTCVPIGDCLGKNQEWSDCGSACPKRCEQKEPVACPAVCRPGCVCKKGFCLRTSGDCVADVNCGTLAK